MDADDRTDADVQAVLEAGLTIPPASKARPSRHAKGRGQGVDRAARGAPSRPAARSMAAPKRDPGGAPGTGRG